MIEIDPGKFVTAIRKRFRAAQNPLQPSCLPTGIAGWVFVLTIFFLLMALPVNAGTAMDASAHEFAQKIAAALPAKNAVSLIIHNVSGLEPSEVSSVQHAVEMELLARGIHTQPGASARVVITFSGNTQGLLWTAEVFEGNDSSKVIFVSVPRESPASPPAGGAATILHAEKFWGGADRILDVAHFPLADGQQVLAVLRPGELVLTTANALANIDLPLDLRHTNLRALSGRIYRFDSQLTIQFGSTSCSVSLDAGSLQECHSAAAAADPPPIPNHGDQTALIHGGCGGAAQVLATGSGDFSQPDTMQAFAYQGNVPTPASNELNFPGPVIALHEFVDAPRTTITAIVRNLKTEDYEAYHITGSCSQ